MRRLAAVTVLALLAVLFSPPPAAAAACPLIVTVGTSIELGAQVQYGESWPLRLGARVGCEVFDRSLGGGTYTTDNRYGDNIRRHIDAAIAEFADHPGPKVMILGGPVNDTVVNTDMGPARWAVHWADAAARDAGWQVIGQAILPFNGGNGCAWPDNWWPTLQDRRQQYNAWGALHFAGRWSNPSMWLAETNSQRADRRWFTDCLHPNRVGHAVVAEVFPTELLGM